MPIDISRKSVSRGKIPVLSVEPWKSSVLVLSVPDVILPAQLFMQQFAANEDSTDDSSTKPTNSSLPTEKPLQILEKLPSNSVTLPSLVLDGKWAFFAVLQFPENGPDTLL